MIGLLALFAFALIWLAVALGLAAKSVETASNTPMILFLLVFLSSGFVRTQTMPEGLRQFAEYQPFSPMVDTVRGCSPAAPSAATPSSPSRGASASPSPPTSGRSASTTAVGRPIRPEQTDSQVVRRIQMRSLSPSRAKRIVGSPGRDSTAA